nr:nuclease-related domain-containing protein [Marinobacter salexigens]
MTRSDGTYRILNNLMVEVSGFNSQIDHFIMYKAGFIVVESKSIQGAVRVNSLGEWERFGVEHRDRFICR